MRPIGWGRERRRRRAASLAPQGALRDYLSAAEQDPRTPLSQVRLLALDFETTSLDSTTGHPLSAGWVAVDGASIRLGGAGSVLLRPPSQGVGDSAVFHGITDDEASLGLDEQTAVERILAALTGRVLLAHHASIESSFLIAACRRIWNVVPEFPCVDTLDLEHRLATRGGSEPVPGSLRLGAARERYGLPAYSAHEALTDALACAELYVAQVSVLGAVSPLRSVLS